MRLWKQGLKNFRWFGSSATLLWIASEIGVWLVHSVISFSWLRLIHVKFGTVLLFVCIHPHQRRCFVLLSHHFNCSLSRIEVKFIVLLPILSFTRVVFNPIWKLSRVCIIASPLLLRRDRSILSAIKAWQVESTLIAWWGSSLWLGILATSSFGFLLVEIIDVHYAVLHEHKMSILIRSLLRLSLFNSFIQEINSLLILLLQFCLDAFILHVLQPVHLEVVVAFLDLRRKLIRVVLVLTAVQHLGLVVVAYCVLEAGVVVAFLCCLSHLGELDVVFIKNYLLNIMRRHLSHE